MGIIVIYNIIKLYAKGITIPGGQNRQKKQSEHTHSFLLIRHSKYSALAFSAILSTGI